MCSIRGLIALQATDEHEKGECKRWQQEFSATCAFHVNEVQWRVCGNYSRRKDVLCEWDAEAEISQLKSFVTHSAYLAGVVSRLNFESLPGISTIHSLLPFTARFVSLALPILFATALLYNLVQPLIGMVDELIAQACEAAADLWDSVWYGRDDDADINAPAANRVHFGVAAPAPAPARSASLVRDRHLSMRGGSSDVLRGYGTVGPSPGASPPRRMLRLARCTTSVLAAFATVVTGRGGPCASSLAMYACARARVCARACV